jgi:hypothetical protein
MNIVADELWDIIRDTARGPFGARPNCGLWSSQRCALFLRGVKVTSNWKERLTHKLLDGDLQEYLMKKEQWTTHSFNNTCWKRNETSTKIISKARQESTAKMCHNFRFTGSRHELWYGEAKMCCTCGQYEDWRHVLTCKSLDAELISADSWSKLKKQMEKWSLPPDMWITIESGVMHYTMNTLKRDTDNMPPEPPLPFGTTFYTPRNILKFALRAQSQIGWDNLLKGRLSRDWITCMDYHFQTNVSKLTGQECITKLILGLWEHMDRIWTYRNNIYHENTTQKVSCYKTR